jgi:hypothetical protein
MDRTNRELRSPSDICQIARDHTINQTIEAAVVTEK